MKETYLTKEELENLTKLNIDGSIYNTEGTFYIYDGSLLKLYNPLRKEYLKDKRKTLENLIEYSDDFPNESLVYPSGLVFVDDSFQGFIMPYIKKNTNLENILKSKNTPLKTKLEYLKEVYKIIDYVDSSKSLILNDIHEANFILDKDINRIKAIDLDSVYFNGCHIYPSKYLMFNKNIMLKEKKYPIDIMTFRAVPNKNTMILCFVYMLLNTLSNSEVSMWSNASYKRYLKFLNQNDCSKELIDCLSNIYNKRTNNYFELEFLDGIDTNRDYKVPKRLRRIDY